MLSIWEATAARQLGLPWCTTSLLALGGPGWHGEDHSAQHVAIGVVVHLVQDLLDALGKLCFRSGRATMWTIITRHHLACFKQSGMANSAQPST